MRTTLRVTICFLILFLFNDCTTKYSYPYSAKNVANNLSKKYAIEIEIIEINNDKITESKKHNTYILKDKNRGILFEAGSYVTMDRHIPLYVTRRWDEYPRDLMRHYHDEVLQLAGKYGIRLIPPLLKNTEFNTERYSPVRPVDSVFIHSFEQLDDVVDLYDEIANLYNFSYVEHDNYTSVNPRLVLNFLSENKADSTVLVELCELLYLDFRSERDDTESSGSSRKIKYTDFIPEKHEVRNRLYKSWNEAVDKGLIATGKVRYKSYESEMFGLMDYDDKNDRYIGIADISGNQVKVHFLQAAPKQIEQNILKADTIIKERRYDDYLQKAFPIIKEKLVTCLQGIGEGFFGEIPLAIETLAEDFSLYSILFKEDGSIFVYYKIQSIIEPRLIVIVLGPYGEYKGEGVLSPNELCSFNDLFRQNVPQKDFMDLYTVF